MSSVLFGVFMLAFVAIGVLWVVRPRAMARHHVRVRYGVQGDVEFSDTQIRIRQVMAVIVLVVGLWTMLSWGGFGF